MNLQQFQNHGWKATDKVVYKGKVLNVIAVYFHSDFFYSDIIGASEENDTHERYYDISEIELYQPELTENK